MLSEHFKEKFNKYELLTIITSRGTIKNCLVFEILADGVKVYPIEKLIDESDVSRIVAKVFVPYSIIYECTKDNINLLFYAVNCQNSFVIETIKHYMAQSHENNNRKN